jgi:uncharacterized membrane protein HdeD (DUF308 family)
MIVIFVPLWSLALLTIFGAITLIVVGIMQAISAMTLGKSVKAA